MTSKHAQALAELETALLAEEGNKQALATKADATCWVIEHLRGQAAYRKQQAKRLTELSRYDASRAESLEDSFVLGSPACSPPRRCCPCPSGMPLGIRPRLR
jgi:hypothetical protein